MNTSSLFQPFSLGNLQLKNRIVMAPMTRSFSPGNVPNEGNVAYYARRAANDVGLIVTEGTCVGHPAASGYPNVPYFYGEESLAGWEKVAAAVHAAGGKIMPQLWHVGAVRKEGQEPDPAVPAYSPSGVIKPDRPRGKAMTQRDIDDVIEAFAQGAADAQRIEFDGVELHGAHGYLIDQFFWEGTNLRTDRYGGDAVSRTTFGAELVAAVRARVGPDFPIVLRYSQWKLQDYEVKLAADPAALERFLIPLVEAGVDVFHCSTRRFWEPEFEGSTLNLAGWTKRLTGKPTITVGSVGLNTGFVDEARRGMVETAGFAPDTLINLLERLENGEFDLVAVGRALLQDPEWVLKVRDSRLDELADYSREALKELY
ncbi:MAG: NADH:flavin oxidoreductase [Ardenticatenaceae bacterium]|nr:NADH:flavin oxidoreductase [Ardenticatenaceae bacterium]